MLLVLSTVSTFIITVVLLPVTIKIATNVGLVDKPSSRKRHEATVPLVGGICIHMALLITFLIFPNLGVTYSLLGWFSAVLVIGVVDDCNELSHRIRLILHTLIIIGIALTDGMIVSSIGAITGGDDVMFFGVAAMLFTVICVLGAVNAVNMSDGADGLLSSLMVVSFIATFILTGKSTGPFNAVILWSVCGACAGFLLFNGRIIVTRARAFLGDAGSTLLGFILVYTLIFHTQGANASFSPVVAGWLLGFPLLDASAVIAIRVFGGKSPFSADRNHFHHVLMDSGLSVRKTVAFILILHFLMIGFAIATASGGGHYVDSILFCSFLILVALRSLFVTSSSMEDETDDSHLATESVYEDMRITDVRNVKKQRESDSEVA